MEFELRNILNTKSLLNSLEYSINTDECISIVSPVGIDLYNKLLEFNKLTFVNKENIQDNDVLLVGDYKGSLNTSDVEGALTTIKTDYKNTYLAIGNLEWRESELSKDVYNSPILVIPVKIDKENDVFSLILNDDIKDIKLNPILEYGLKTKCSIPTPSVNGHSKIEDFFYSVQKIADLNGFNMNMTAYIVDLDSYKVDVFNQILKNENEIKSSEYFNDIYINNNENESEILINTLNDISFDSKVKSLMKFCVSRSYVEEINPLILSRTGSNLNIEYNDNGNFNNLIANIIAGQIDGNKKTLILTDNEESSKEIEKNIQKYAFNKAVCSVYNEKINSDKKEMLLDTFDSTKYDIDYTDNIEKLISEYYIIKNTIDEYYSELSKSIEPINMSVIEVLEKYYEKVNNNTIVDVEIENIDGLSVLDLHRNSYIINKIATTNQSDIDEINSTIWSYVDFGKVDDNIDTLYDKIKLVYELNKLWMPICEFLPQIKVDSCFNVLIDDILYFIQSYGVDAIKDYDSISENLSINIRNIMNQKEEKLNKANTIFNNKIFDINATEVKQKIVHSNHIVHTILKQLMSDVLNKELISNYIKNYKYDAQNILDNLENIFSDKKLYKDLLGGFEIKTVENIRKAKRLFDFCFSTIDVSKSWIENGTQSSIDLINEYKTISREIKELENEIGFIFNQNIFKLDYMEIVKTLDGIQSTPIHMRMNRTYRDSVALIKQVIIDNEGKFDAEYIQSKLVLIDSYNAKNDKLEFIKNSIISEFKLDVFDFDESKLLEKAEMFEIIRSFYSEEIPSGMNIILTEKENIKEEYRKVYESLISLDNNIMLKSIKNSEIELIQSNLSTLIIAIEEAQGHYNVLAECIDEEVNPNIALTKLDEFIQNTAGIERYDELGKKMLDDYIEIIDVIGIDIDLLNAEIQKLNSIVENIMVCGLDKNESLDLLKKDEFIKYCTTLKEKNKEVEKYIEKTSQLKQFFVENYLENINTVQKVNDTLKAVVESENIDHSKIELIRIVGEAKSSSVQSFIDFMKTTDVKKDEYIDNYMAGFYKAWLNKYGREVFDNYDKIQSNFNKLDKLVSEINTIADARILCDYSNGLPEFNTNSIIEDEKYYIRNISNSDYKYKDLFNKATYLLQKFKPIIIIDKVKAVQLVNNDNINFDTIIVHNAGKFNINEFIYLSKSVSQVILLNKTSNYTDSIKNNLWNSVKTKQSLFKLKNIYASTNSVGYKLVNAIEPNTYNFINEYNDTSGVKYVNYIDDFDNNISKNELIEIEKIVKGSEEKFDIVFLIKSQFEQFKKEYSHLKNCNSYYILDNIKINSNNLIIPYTFNLSKIANTEYNNIIRIKDIINIINNKLNKVYIISSCSADQVIVNENIKDTIQTLYTLLKFGMSKDTGDNETEVKKNIFKNLEGIEYTCKGAVYRNECIKDIYSDENYNYYQIFDYLNGCSSLNKEHYIFNSLQTFFNDDYRSMFIARVIQSENLKEMTKKFDWSDFVKVNSNKEKDEFKFKKYSVTNIYEIEPSKDENIFIANAIVHIVNTEAPIHIEVLYKRLSEVLGNLYSRQQMEKITAHVLKRYVEELVDVKGEFLWKNGQNDAYARKLGNEIGVEFVCQEELANGIMEILDKSYGITVIKLLDATAVAFGYSKNNYAVINRLESILISLIENNFVYIVNGKVIKKGSNNDWI